MDEKLLDKLSEKIESGQVLRKEDFGGLDIDEIVEALKELEVIVNWGEYGERGYDNPEKEVLFGDWNYVDYSLQEELEENGYKIEWFDEWVFDENGLAYRTQPDSVGWEPSYFVDDGEILSIEDNVDRYVELYKNDCTKAVVSYINLEEMGWRPALDDKSFCSGWYDSCDNLDPCELVKQIDSKKYDYLFQIKGSNPFAVNYKLYTKEKECI